MHISNMKLAVTLLTTIGCSSPAWADSFQWIRFSGSPAS